jgi:prolyl-tRNA synthetase
VAEKLAEGIKELGYIVKIDDRDLRPGPKFYEWEKKGIPVRIEIGVKDLAKHSVVMVRRDTSEKQEVGIKEAAEFTKTLLNKIQKDLFAKALKFQKDNTREIDTWDEFKKVLEGKGGFLSAHWCGNTACEAQIKEETKATIRCIPFNQKKENDECIRCGKKSDGRVLFAKAY